MKMVKQNKLSWTDIWPPPGKIQSPSQKLSTPGRKIPSLFSDKSYYKFSFTPKEMFIAHFNCPSHGHPLTNTVFTLRKNGQK